MFKLNSGDRSSTVVSAHGAGPLPRKTTPAAPEPWTAATLPESASSNSTTSHGGRTLARVAIAAAKELVVGRPQ